MTSPSSFTEMLKSTGGPGRPEAKGQSSSLPAPHMETYPRGETRTTGEQCLPVPKDNLEGCPYQWYWKPTVRSGRISRVILLLSNSLPCHPPGQPRPFQSNNQPQSQTGMDPNNLFLSGISEVDHPPLVQLPCSRMVHLRLGVIQLSWVQSRFHWKHHCPVHFKVGAINSLFQTQSASPPAADLSSQVSA